MTKRILSLVLVVALFVSMLTISASAANYTNKTNTFDIFESGTYKACTSNNSGVVMKSRNYSGTMGTITFNSYFSMTGWSFSPTTYYNSCDYVIVGSVKNGAVIKFYIGSTLVGKGKIHTANNRTTFGSITKIDSIGGGFYMKYR